VPFMRGVIKKRRGLAKRLKKKKKAFVKGPNVGYSNREGERTRGDLVASRKEGGGRSSRIETRLVGRKNSLGAGKKGREEKRGEKKVRCPPRGEGEAHRGEKGKGSWDSTEKKKSRKSQHNNRKG